MNETRRMMLKVFGLIPWTSFSLWGRRGDPAIPEYFYDWTANEETGGTSTDPRMPYLLYGNEAPFVYVNGILVSHVIKDDGVSVLRQPGLYITRVQGGARGWVEHSIRDRNNQPIIHTVKRFRQDSTIHNGRWVTFETEEMLVEKIRGEVIVLPQEDV